MAVAQKNAASAGIIKALARLESTKKDLTYAINYGKIREIRATMRDAKARQLQEDTSLTDTVANARLYSQSAAAVLKTNLQRIKAIAKKTAADIEPFNTEISRIKEESAERETKELAAVSGKKQATLPKNEEKLIIELETAKTEISAKAVKEAKKIMLQTIDFLNNTYILSMTSYFVAVAGKYKAIIWAIDEIAQSPYLRAELAKDAALKHEIRMERWKAEWNEYEAITEKITIDIQKWTEFVTQTVLPKIKQAEHCSNLANILEQFLKEHGQELDRAGQLTELQWRMRIFKAIAMADSLARFAEKIVS